MNDLIVNGKSVVSGGTFGKVNVNGIVSIENDVICDTLRLNGVCDITGNVKVGGKAELDGVCKISGDLDAETIDFDGHLSVSGNMSAESAALSAVLSAEGTFNVGSLDLRFYFGSRVNEIVGSTIKIRRGRLAMTFRSELIEGDIIDIEHCEIRTVRGDDVVIGKGCRIEKVEYRNELTVHPKASVRETVKLN
ncbi:MAG: polymer-forming cytoskeletal protein [Methanomassiliicoccaceae archaeon]|jgi:cytoskeletal protein CcmA (bactofilin family)|nr:polymer-forming cytoskeletal protein [Methanomassiliicoccaceae archaeon]